MIQIIKELHKIPPVIPQLPSSPAQQVPKFHKAHDRMNPWGAGRLMGANLCAVTSEHLAPISLPQAPGHEPQAPRVPSWDIFL